MAEYCACWEGRDDCPDHPDGISQACRPPDRVPVYGYVTMTRTGFERCLVERRYVSAFKGLGFVVTDPPPDARGA